jgi:3-hydroxyacyl-[acyl-carrier-protein] dehydratase
MKNVQDLIPHRKPFLFVDRLVSVDPQRIVGERTFPPDEPMFAGHFPAYPVVPGVILVETMAQCGGAGVVDAGLCDCQIIFLASVNNVKFRRQVRPGEKIRMEVENVKVTRRLIKQRGQAWVGDELAAEAEWVCLVGKA